MGYKNIAKDVLTRSNLLRVSWDSVSSNEAPKFDISNVDQLETYATLERQQAYTQFVKTYDQVRRVVSFLRWDDGDADDIAPSLYAGRSSKKKPEVDASGFRSFLKLISAPTHSRK
jgi:hypothetical protein